MPSVKELQARAEAILAESRDHDVVMEFWRACCDDPPSEGWAYARCRVAEYALGHGANQRCLDVLAPVLAAPVHVVGDKAHAVARCVAISAREMLDQPVPLDEVAAVAEACEAADEPDYAARRHYHLGVAARQAQDFDRAVLMFQRAFASYTKAGSSAAARTRVRIAEVLHQRGDDDGALVELQWVGAYIGRQYAGSWQLIYNDVIALRADIHAAAAVRLGSRAAAVAHYQHAFELSGPISSSAPSIPPRPRRDQQSLIDRRDRAELTPGNAPMVATLEDLEPIAVAFATRSWDAVLSLADGVLANPVALSHPRTWLVACVAREVSCDALGRDVELDVLADTSWQLSRLFHCIASPELEALSKLGTEVLARRFGHTWFSARAPAPS